MLQQFEHTNLELLLDLFTMWASSSKKNTNISLELLGIFTKALSAKDKRIIPFVEWAAYKFILAHNKLKKPL